MLYYEFKKLYIKQFFLLIAIICIVLKCFFLFVLQYSEKEGFTPQDNENYKSLINQIGGRITPENEEQINNYLNQLYDAEKSCVLLRSQLLNGEFDSTNDYASEYARILPVLQQKKAIGALNDDYLYANEDEENRWIISSALPVIETNSIDYILLIFVLILPILVFYQEEKTRVASLIKTYKAGSIRTIKSKILLVALTVIAMCSIFFVLEFVYCLSVFQKGEIFAPLQSLRFYSNSPINITIIEAFWRISAVKLFGYLFVALLSSVIITHFKKQLISFLIVLIAYIIEPFAFNQNLIYYTPFGLMKATGFFRGDAYTVSYKGSPSESIVQDFFMVSKTQTFVVLFISLIIICLAIIFCYRTYYSKSKSFKATLLLCICICLLSGCHMNNKDSYNVSNIYNSNFIAQNDTAYFLIDQSNITMVNKSTGEESNILRDAFISESTNIKAICCSNEYLFYLISTNDSNDIYEISLHDFKQNHIFTQRQSDTDAFLGLTKKQTSFGISNINKMLYYNKDIYFASHDNENIYRYNISKKTVDNVISDGVYLNNISIMNDTIYYINSVLELKSYDIKSGKTQVVSDKICTDLYVYDNKVFISTASGIFSIDIISGEEERLTEKPSIDVTFDGNNLFYKNQGGDLVILNSDGEEQVLYEKIAQFEIIHSNNTIVYTYFSEGEFKHKVLNY